MDLANTADSSGVAHVPSSGVGNVEAGPEETGAATGYVATSAGVRGGSLPSHVAAAAALAGVGTGPITQGGASSSLITLNKPTPQNPLAGWAGLLGHHTEASPNLSGAASRKSEPLATPELVRAKVRVHEESTRSSSIQVLQIHFRSSIHSKYTTTSISAAELTLRGRTTVGGRAEGGVIGETGCHRREWKEL